MNPDPQDTFFSTLESEQSISLSTEGLAKGIDNYHVDVNLSRKFSSETRKLVTLLISQVATPSKKTWDNSKQLKRFRNLYLDMMTVLIHRVKTDLDRDHVLFLQLAVVKHVVKAGRFQLDKEITTTSTRLTDFKSKGASEALGTDQRLFWLRRNYDDILYQVNKSLFAQIQKAEDQELALVRQQFLGQDSHVATSAMTNPLLWTSNISSLTLQLQNYSLWDINSEETGFKHLDSLVSELISRTIPEASYLPLAETNSQQGDTEIGDELGGLFQLQSYIGPTVDSKSILSEEFSWLEIPGNAQKLFSKKLSQQWLTDKRQQLGFFRAWAFRKEIRRLDKVLNKLVKALSKDSYLQQLLASSFVKKFVTPQIPDQIETKHVCLFLAGKMTLQKLQDSILGSQKLNSEQVKVLEQYKSELAKLNSEVKRESVLSLLLSIGKFRHDLKLLRFAHRAFNRINILTVDDELRLSKSAGTLYQMPIRDEVEEDDDKICHHTILKADVRGSTTVTDELLKKNLNPASYFSMRFFNPINKILDTYSANKVFIEGDAIILSFLEYEGSPEQWFSVARACGYAKDMLTITGANNRYSSQMGLPLLELGVGICFSPESPRFLYDEDHPIMISSAIGLADRMSGCSWKLRAAIKKSLFNVDVLEIAEGETSKGEKGQDFARYNVNGINMDDLAFEKLSNEIRLQRLSVKLNGEDYVFHVGSYPDAKGKKKDLVIREGYTGTWENDQILPDRNSDLSYYEVVVNRKVVPAILDAAKKVQLQGS
ncbi:MAG: hypothetical protein AB8B95_04750 [Pseudohongiellaceae bacterium]